jgi:hypothetical protein
MPDPKQRRKREVQINESENISLSQLESAEQHFSVTAASYYDDWQFRSNHRPATVSASM